MPENFQQEETNTQNEENRRTEEAVIRKPEDKNDGVQLPSRYEQYCFAKLHLRGTPRPQVFPFGNPDEATDTGHQPNPPQGEVAQTVRSRYGNGTGSHIEQLNNPTHSNNRIYGTDGLSPTINTAQGGMRQPKIVERTPLKFLTRNQKNIEGDYAFTVDSMNTGGVKVDMKIRRLTPTECERLQGFPDGWTESVSDTQRYKTLGNAVTVNTVRDVMEKLLQ